MTKTAYDEDRVDSALDALVGEGTLTPHQADVVRERISAPAPPRAGGTAAATLAAAYVGSGLLAAAVATLIGQSWDSLGVLGRVLAFAAVTALLVGAGATLRGRFDQARGLAWVVAVLSAGGLGAALFSGHPGDGSTPFLAAGIAALALSVPLLALRPAAPQTFGVVAAVVVTTIAVLTKADVGGGWSGTILWAVGCAIGAAAVLKVLPVPSLAIALGGLVALVGAHISAIGSVLLCAALALLLAAAAYALALRGEAAVPLTIASLTVATAGPHVFGEWLGDSVGAPGILAVSGAIVLGAAALHVRLVRRRTPEAPGG